MKGKVTRAGRKRRLTGWTLLTLGVLVAGVWVWSGWNSWTVREAEFRHFSVARGVLQFFSAEGPAFDHGRIALDAERMRAAERIFRKVNRSATPWCFTECFISRRDVGGQIAVWSVALSFWLLPLLLWTPAALLLRSGIIARRRANAGMCTKCGYDLAGLPPAADSPCPECGKAEGRPRINAKKRG